MCHSLRHFQTKMLRYSTLLLLVARSLSQQNNICSTIESYLNFDSSPNCRYKPDLDLETPDLIRKYIGTVEFHDVTTEDGYVLTIFRIPRPKPKGVVLIMYPIYANPKVSLNAGNITLEYELWRAGYDVWLGNNRGGRFTRHLTFSETDRAFWNFSFHEVAIHDTPTIVSYVKKRTGGEKIIYWGHSQSADTGIIYASLMADDAVNSIKAMVVYAPTLYHDTQSGFRLTSKFAPILERLVDLTEMAHLFSFLPRFNEFIGELFQIYPKAVPEIYKLYLAIFGGVKGETDPELFTLNFMKFNWTVTWKTLRHIWQNDNGIDRFYDYGKANVELYGSGVPPRYPIKNMRVPIFIIYSEDDAISLPKATEMLYKKLPKETKIHGKLKVSGLNHAEIYFGKHRQQLFYNRVLSFLSKIT